MKYEIEFEIELNMVHQQKPSAHTFNRNFRDESDLLLTMTSYTRVEVLTRQFND